MFNSNVNICNKTQSRNRVGALRFNRLTLPLNCETTRVTGKRVARYHNGKKYFRTHRRFDWFTTVPTTDINTCMKYEVRQ